MGHRGSLASPTLTLRTASLHVCPSPVLLPVAHLPAACGPPTRRKFATKIVGGGKGKEKEKESTPAKLSKRGALDFQQELQLDVKGEERRNAQSAGERRRCDRREGGRHCSRCSLLASMDCEGECRMRRP